MESVCFKINAARINSLTCTAKKNSDDARKKSAYTNDIKYVQQNDPPPPLRWKMSTIIKTTGLSSLLGWIRQDDQPEHWLIKSEKLTQFIQWKS